MWENTPINIRFYKNIIKNFLIKNTKYPTGNKFEF